MKVVGYHITDQETANSDGEFCTQDIYNFLVANKGECIKVLYHLDYSVACLLKLLAFTEEECKRLLETGELYTSGYNLQYLPQKWFSIGYGRHGGWSGFSDMSQYMKPDLTLDAKSCAYLAMETGRAVCDVLEKLGLHPKSLTSPVSVFGKEVICRMNLPSVDDMPKRAAWYAYECCHGPWIEAFKKGFFSITYDYDIKSAYGSQTAKLIDTRFGEWRYSTKYLPEALYGYCYGTVTIDKPFSPIFYSEENNENTFAPNGTWQTFLTKGEVDFIDEWGLGKFELIDGWWWLPVKIISPVYKRPLFNLVRDLYQKKEAAKEFEATIIKRIISGIWGKFLEVRKDGMGKYFNPCWAAEVETNNKLQVADFVLGNGLTQNILSVTVDGCLTSHPSTVEENGAMGSWKMTAYCPSIIVSSGMQAIKERKHEGVFAIDYDWLFREMTKKPKTREYEVKGLSPVTLGKAITQNRFADLGKIEEITRTIDVGYELKRCYRTQPKNGGELLANQYDSVPWDVSLIKQGV